MSDEACEDGEDFGGLNERAGETTVLRGQRVTAAVFCRRVAVDNPSAECVNPSAEYVNPSAVCVNPSGET